MLIPETISNSKLKGGNYMSASYHAVIESSGLTVYRQSDCASNSDVGKLYNGEVFTLIREHNGYMGHYEIRFLTSNGQYANGYINTGSGFGNLAFYGKSVTESKLGSSPCYRFKLRKKLNVVTTGNSFLATVPAGGYVYTRGATAGSANPANMYICGYTDENNKIIPCDAFVTLDYTGGSMFAKNFCLYKD